MTRKTAFSGQRKDDALTKRYRQIGISAVAAAARYQEKKANKKASASAPSTQRTDESKTKTKPASS